MVVYRVMPIYKSCHVIAASLISMHVNCLIPVLVSSFYLTTEDAASAKLQLFMQVLNNVIEWNVVRVSTDRHQCSTKLTRMYCHTDWSRGCVTSLGHVVTVGGAHNQINNKDNI